MQSLFLSSPIIIHPSYCGIAIKVPCMLLRRVTRMHAPLGLMLSILRSRLFSLLRLNIPACVLDHLSRSSCIVAVHSRVHLSISMAPHRRQVLVNKEARLTSLAVARRRTIIGSSLKSMPVLSLKKANPVDGLTSQSSIGRML